MFVKNAYDLEQETVLRETELELAIGIKRRIGEKQVKGGWNKSAC